MYVVWLLPARCSGSTGIFRNANMCPGFLSPKKTLVTVASEEKRHWEAKCKKWCGKVKDQSEGNRHWHNYEIR